MNNCTSVVSVIAKMIYNWPTLYSTRMDCLERIFTSRPDWDNGYPVFEDITTVSNMVDKPINDIIADEVSKEIENLGGMEDKFVKGKIAAVKLRILKDYHDIYFKRTNADVIAEANPSGNKFSAYPMFTTYCLNHLPFDKLNQEWKDVFIDYCNEVILFKKLYLNECIGKYAKYNNDYKNRIELFIQESAATAEEALIRFVPEHTKALEIKNRQDTILKISHDAEKYGYKLVPINKNQI